MKKVIFFTAVVLLLSFAIFSQEIPDSVDQYVPGAGKVLRDLQSTMYPPDVHSVTVDPEKPKADEDITVTAEIYNDWNVTDDETMEGYLYFSIDGGKTWEEVEMEQDENDEKKWFSIIPGQESGTEIIYYLRGGDSSGNYYTDLPCKVTNWPPTEEKPEICLFRIAPDDTPIDDESELVPDDLDMQEGYVGYDDKNVYVQIKVQGKIAEGKTNPMKMNGYALVFLNPDIGNTSNILTQLEGVAYSPLAAKMLNYDNCLAIYARNGKDITLVSTGVKCDASGPNLFIKIGKDILGENPSGKLKVSSLSAVVLSISASPYGQLGDYLRLTTFHPIDRVIKVE